MKHIPDSRQNRHAQSGFSLLEMLIAVGILSAAAYVALDTVGSDTGQIRSDLTERRMQQVRRALVGNPELSINGVPVVSGFVADTGRLPACLEALLVANPDCDGVGGDDFPAGQDHPAYGDAIAGNPPGLLYGWRGPYITADPDGVFDGWGNGDNTDFNFGWAVDAPVGTDAKQLETVVSFDVTSQGRDRLPDSDLNAELTGFGLDQPMSGIDASHFFVNVQSTDLKVNVEVTTADQEVCIGILAPDPNDDDNARNWRLHYGDTPVTVTNAAPVDVTFAASLDLTAPTPNIPIGMRSIIVYDAADATVTPLSCAPALDDADLVANGVIHASYTQLFVPGVTPSVMHNIILP